MALVKCTKYIKEHVEGKINELFKERINEARELRGTPELVAAELIYNQVHTPERMAALDLVEKAYVGYILTTETNHFKFKAKISPDFLREFDVTLPTKRRMLASFATTWGDAPTIEDLPESVKCAIIEAHARTKAVVEQKTNFKVLFNDAWNKVKSVNELVKAWPAVVDLLPPGTMDRINRKNGPRKKEEQVFDAAALNVELLKAKVAR